MKKYFTIAALLGVIAFASVSFLAQADEKFDAAGTPAAAAATAATATAADSAAAPAETKTEAETVASEAATQDDEECAAAAENSKNPEEIEAAYKKCMADKGHTDEGSGAADVKDAPAEEKDDAAAK